MTAQRPRIAVVGSINVDLVVRTPRRPAAGETLAGTSFDLFPGGKGANQAVAAARLGASVTMVGRVGADTFASTGLRELEAADVDCAAVAHDPDQSTGIAAIVVDDRGENSIVIVAGANGAWSEQDMLRAEAAARAAQVLLLQHEIPQEVNVRAARAGHAAGATVVLNPAPAEPIPPALLASLDVLTPNAHEAALLTSGSESAPEAAAYALQKLGIRRVVVTLGSAGALYLDQNLGQVAALPVDVVDSTAAGDAFNGALAVALARGLPLPDAVRVGCVAGSLATTRPGAQPSMPTLDDVQRYVPLP